MSDSDIARATGIPLPFVAGIRATESGGNPHVIRFEPHLFIKLRPDAVEQLDEVLGHGFVTADEERRYVWSQSKVPYTRGKTRAASDSRLETGREAFDHAYLIDGVAAIRSTSFGAFQVLGAHLLALFPGGPARALSRFDADPTDVSDRLLVQWLHENPKALDAAKGCRIDEFITRYNGANDTARYRARFDPAFRSAGGKL